ncbi:MAG TPA: hypothetical protein VFX16_32960 [Pseudonocardiaceae bacterium]|nr:hypothetical protein [Pseudonocardiaceae bacterium]
MPAFRRDSTDDEFLRRQRELRRAPNPETMAFLERLQAATFRRPPTPRPPTYNTPESIKSIIPNATADDIAMLRQYLTEVDSSIRPPTAYEGLFHTTVQLHAGQLDAAVARFGRWPSPGVPPVFALMDVGHVNARTIRVPTTGDHVVLVDEELLKFVAQLSHTVALAFHAQPRNDNNALLSFLDVVLHYVMTGRVPDAQRARLPQPSEVLASTITQGAETFVLAHEYVHVLEGHLNDGRHDVTGVTDGRVSQSLWSVVQEGLADTIGLNLTIAVLGEAGHDMRFAYWGAELFLSANEIMLKAISQLRTGDETGMREHERHQHAIFDTRRQAMEYMMRNALQQASPDKSASEQRWPTIRGELHAVHDVLAHLWSELAPLLRISHARGARPSSVWEN